MIFVKTIQACIKKIQADTKIYTSQKGLSMYQNWDENKIN